MRAAGLVIALLLIAPLRHAAAQEAGGIRIYLDCGYRCDTDFIKTEIPIVDFVTERTEADIHLLVTTERTGSGGDAYTLAFLGRRKFAGVSDTLTVATGATDTGDEERRTVVKVIKLGLGPYLVRAHLTQDVGITMQRSRPSDESSVEADPWNYWVFSFGANGMFNGQESSSMRNVHTSVSANRTTEDLKVRFGLSGSFNEQNFDYGSTSYRNKRRNGALSGLVVKSIGSNWAAGIRAEASTSSYSNTDASVTAGPAVEYNLFPYSESTRRELRVQYGLELGSFWYEEETIFNLEQEKMLSHYLRVSLDLKQPWGSLSFSTNARHYWTNFDRSLTDAYSLGVYGGAQVRLVRGLSLNFHGNYGLIRDQFSLPLSDATEEEVLLQSRRLPTGYDYFFTAGFSYRFGSIFNTVVNPRFGGGGGGMTFVMM